MKSPVEKAFEEPEKAQDLLEAHMVDDMDFASLWGKFAEEADKACEKGYEAIR